MPVWLIHMNTNTHLPRIGAEKQHQAAEAGWFRSCPERVQLILFWGLFKDPHILRLYRVEPRSCLMSFQRWRSSTWPLVGIRVLELSSWGCCSPTVSPPFHPLLIVFQNGCRSVFAQAGALLTSDFQRRPSALPESLSAPTCRWEPLESTPSPLKGTQGTQSTMLPAGLASPNAVLSLPTTGKVLCALEDNSSSLSQRPWGPWSGPCPREFLRPFHLLLAGQHRHSWATVRENREARGWNGAYANGAVKGDSKCTLWLLLKVLLGAHKKLVVQIRKI